MLPLFLPPRLPLPLPPSPLSFSPLFSPQLLPLLLMPGSPVLDARTALCWEGPEGAARGERAAGTFAHTRPLPAAAACRAGSLPSRGWNQPDASRGAERMGHHTIYGASRLSPQLWGGPSVSLTGKGPPKPARSSSEPPPAAASPRSGISLLCLKIESGDIHQGPHASVLGIESPQILLGRISRKLEPEGCLA